MFFAKNFLKPLNLVNSYSYSAKEKFTCLTGANVMKTKLFIQIPSLANILVVALEQNILATGFANLRKQVK